MKKWLHHSALFHTHFTNTVRSSVCFLSSNYTDFLNHPTLVLQSFQKEITLNTEHIDGLIVFGEGLIQKSSPQDAALIEDELEELHSYCQEVFSRLVRFHQRLSQPPVSLSFSSSQFINSESKQKNTTLPPTVWLSTNTDLQSATIMRLIENNKIIWSKFKKRPNMQIVNGGDVTFHKRLLLVNSRNIWIPESDWQSE